MEVVGKYWLPRRALSPVLAWWEYQFLLFNHGNPVQRPGPLVRLFASMPKKIEPGSMLTVEWQGKPVWVIRRTAENLKNLVQQGHREELRDPDSAINQQPDYTMNEFRSIKKEIFVAVGICTHLGCVPHYEPDGRAEVKHALFFCPCHGSTFDLAGRVFKSVPAPTNLIIPPHQYLDNGTLEIGVDEQTS